MTKSADIKATVHDQDCYKFNNVKWDRDPKFIIDIGANVGWFTKLAAEKKPNAKILAYELMQENYEQALQNLKNLSNISFFNKAEIGNNRATAYIRASNNIGGHSTLYENEDTYKSESRYRDKIYEKDKKSGSLIATDLPEQISFIEIIEENNIDYIDFLKLDCEGCEHELLLHIIENNLDKKILNMSLEFHGRTWPEWPEIKKELENRFESHSKNGAHILIYKNNYKQE